MTQPRPLHDLVLAIIDDLALVKGRACLTDEKLRQWGERLARADVRRQTRVFLDCAEAAMRLEGARQPGAALQLLLLSGIGLSDGRRAAARREGADIWSRLNPGRFSAVC